MGKGRINEADIDRLKDVIRLDEVVRPHTELKASGPGRFMARCPFHNEKTPSFSLDATKGVYHCFGCGVGGNAFTFLMELEGLNYVEAVERLAAQFGVTLHYERQSTRQAHAQSKRTRLRELLQEAATFYHQQLLGPDGESARRYLSKRHIQDAAIDHWNLGWAPDQWDGLSTYLMGKGASIDDLESAGLSTRGRHGPIDRFRARVMYPIADRGGTDVVAFGGRIVPEAQRVTVMQDGPGPKYINSPKNEVYDKSRVLFGLAQARRAIVKANNVYVVEGYMDVIGLAQIGIENVVATCGTALTGEHFAMLERLDTAITLCLDPDDAGMQAAERARELAAQTGVSDLGIVKLPEGLDPADLANERGLEGTTNALALRVSAVAFQIQYLLDHAQLDTPEQRRAAYQSTFPLLGKLESWDLRYQYIFDYVAPVVGIPGQRIEDELNVTYPLHRQQRRTARTTAPPPVGASIPNTGYGEADHPTQDKARHAQLHLERMAIQTALQNPSWITVSAEHFTTELSKQVIQAVQQSISFDELIERMPNDEARDRVRALVTAESFVTDSEQAAQLQTSLERALVRRQWQDVLNAIEFAQGQERTDLMLKAQALNQKWRSMSG
ncbi:DNA primase [Stomatohabitans albus]|uniref:DNA primase n=1 Tax=Stomatohabitans albus TaxID=3110766 RepID=UPI00300D8AAF